MHELSAGWSAQKKETIWPVVRAVISVANACDCAAALQDCGTKHQVLQELDVEKYAAPLNMITAVTVSL